jgi:uncharacterized protein YbaP (TraB family)
MTDLFGVAGNELLDEVPLPRAFAIRIESLRDLIEVFDREVAMLSHEIDHWLSGDKGIWRLRRSPASGRCSARCSAPRSGT